MGECSLRPQHSGGKAEGGHSTGWEIPGVVWESTHSWKGSWGIYLREYWILGLGVIPKEIWNLLVNRSSMTSKWVWFSLKWSYNSMSNVMACSTWRKSFQSRSQLATSTGSARCSWQLVEWVWGYLGSATEDPGRPCGHHETAEGDKGKDSESLVEDVENVTYTLMLFFLIV